MADDERGARVQPEGDELFERRSRGGQGRLIAALAVVVLLAVLAGAGAAAQNERKPALYRSAAVLLIDQEPALSRARDNGLLVKLTTLRIKYADLVATSTFTSALATDLGLPGSGLGGSVAVVLPPNSLLLQVVATGPDRTRARTLAQGAADKMVKDLTEEQTRLGVAANDQVTLSVVTPALPAVKVAPVRSDSAKRGALAAGAVLVVGLALIAVVRRRR